MILPIAVEFARLPIGSVFMCDFDGEAFIFEKASPRKANPLNPATFVPWPDTTKVPFARRDICFSDGCKVYPLATENSDGTR